MFNRNGSERIKIIYNEENETINLLYLINGKYTNLNDLSTSSLNSINTHLLDINNMKNIQNFFTKLMNHEKIYLFSGSYSTNVFATISTKVACFNRAKINKYNYNESILFFCCKNYLPNDLKIVFDVYQFPANFRSLETNNIYIKDSTATLKLSDSYNLEGITEDVLFYDRKEAMSYISQIFHKREKSLKNAFINFVKNMH